VLCMFALCEPENAEQCVEAMRREAAQLSAGGAAEKEIARVKNLRRTSLAVESEAPFYRLGQIADDLEYFGRPRSAGERISAVERISTATIAQYFERFPI